MSVSEARYVPDLTGLMAECERNYARLLQLLPDLEQASIRKVAVTYPNGCTATIRFEVLEAFRYTSTVQIQHCVSDDTWLYMPKIVVRLYHDARMAEVVEAQYMRQLKGVYRYPNTHMYQADEKVQRNLYLGQWLCYCLQYGYASQPVCMVGQ